MSFTVLKNFVVFEGIDGAGTTTQLDVLKNKPESAKIHFSAEPTGLATGKFLREILGGRITVSPETQVYLFAADRSEHIWGKDGIKEQTGNGKLCISDRYFFSSLAYQGVNAGEELPRRVNETFPLPEILFFFNISPEISLSRITGRGVTEIFENRPFLEKTAERYKAIVEHYKKVAPEMKIVEIDAALPKEEISKIIWSELKNFPMFKE